jgi:hypothetical protein
LVSWAQNHGKNSSDSLIRGCRKNLQLSPSQAKPSQAKPSQAKPSQAIEIIMVFENGVALAFFLLRSRRTLRFCDEHQKKGESIWASRK